MLFNSYDFVFLFFPLVLAGYGFLKKIWHSSLWEPYQVRIANGLLLAASLVFYGWMRPSFLPVLVGSMALNYGIFLLMERTKRKKLWLAAGLIINLGALIYFKYAKGISALPLGISFFTFTQIAFLMEAYGGKLHKVPILSYGLYVSFFPKIMQGPIALPGEMLPQFEKRDTRVSWEKIYKSFYLFVLGLSKKVLLADTFGKAADFGYANLSGLNTWDGIIVMLSYTLQLYFDFGGYCDMAMGIAGMLGFDLPVNFDSPYKAANIIEFWKGWHITLTRFFTKYLYIPLGGNRKGKGRTYCNYLLVFLVSGIWHGVGLQFVVWGMMHGALYVLTRMWQDRSIDGRDGGRMRNRTGNGVRMGNSVEAGNGVQGRNGVRSRDGVQAEKGVRSENGFVKNSVQSDTKNSACYKRLWQVSGRVLKVFLTFLYVNVAWIFFRASSVREAVELIKRIISFQLGRVSWDLAGSFNLDEFWYVIKVLGLDRWQNAHYILMAVIVTGGLLLVFFGKNALAISKKAKPGVANSVIMAVLLVWCVLSFSGVSSFLYVNF